VPSPERRAQLPFPLPNLDGADLARALEGPLKLIEGMDSAIRRIDGALRGFDDFLSSLDGRLLSRPPAPIPAGPSAGERQHVPSPSYPGQQPIDYCYECLPADTLIYGNHSVYPIQKLRAANYSMKYRVLTHRGRGARVVKFFSREYKGPLVVINEYYTNVPLKVTPEHPILVARNVREKQTAWQDRGIDEGKLEWVPARELTDKDFIAFPRIRDVKDVAVVSEDLAELMGWYVAEGCLSESGRAKSVAFSLGHHEEDKIARVVELIERLFGVEPSITTKGTAVRITLASKYWAPMFEQFGREACERDIPTWFLYLPENKQYRFLKGYVLGDGTINADHVEGEKLVRVQMATCSTKLAYRLRLLLFRLGILHSVDLIEGKETKTGERAVRGRPYYVIMVGGGSTLKLLKELGIEPNLGEHAHRGHGWNYGWVGERYVFIPIKSVTTEDFEGIVYNLHVEGDESYLTIHGALHNCLERHYLKALGLLEEAERFSLGKGEITPEARRRIELAVKEIVTAEEDLGTRAEDPEVASMLDEIRREQRDLRKWMWSERLLTTQRDVNKLREAIARMKGLVDLTNRAASYYHEKYGRCSYCEALAREIAAKFNVSEREALDAIYGLASDSRERVDEAVEKLKRVGAFEYAMRRVREMYEELRGGEGGKA
jgi:hypothetical protein